MLKSPSIHKLPLPFRIDKGGAASSSLGGEEVLKQGGKKEGGGLTCRGRRRRSDLLDFVVACSFCSAMTPSLAGSFSHK